MDVHGSSAVLLAVFDDDADCDGTNCAVFVGWKMSRAKFTSDAANSVSLCVDNDAAKAKSRLAHVALLNLNLRFMENWRTAQIAAGQAVLDYESLMIVMAIIVISAETILRTDLESDLHSLTQPLPASKVRKVNVSSIAAATAINRETVRRKVNNLERAGWLVRTRDGIRTVQGVIPFEVLHDIIGAQLDALTRTVNHLAKLKILSPNQLQR